jgi:hypothetical protein
MGIKEEQEKSKGVNCSRREVEKGWGSKEKVERERG